MLTHTNQKKVGVTILLSDKVDFRARTIMCIPNRALKYVMQKLTELQEATDNSTIIIRDFYTPLLVINRIQQAENQ